MVAQTRTLIETVTFLVRTVSLLSRKHLRRSLKPCRAKQLRQQRREEDRITTDLVQSKVNSIRQICIKKHGFVSDPDLPLWRNVLNATLDMPLKKLLGLRSNMSCHNMCTTISPPPGIETVLGLGFTFCLQKPRPEPDHEGSMDRFRRDTRLRELFQGQPDDDGSFIPKLHIKSKWQPRPRNKDLERRLNDFDQELSQLHNTSKKRQQQTNLDQEQRHLIRQLRKNDDLIVWPSDKNLGPAIIERSVYIQRALGDHLLDTSTYVQLTEREANNQLNLIKRRIESLANRGRNILSTAERSYINREVSAENSEQTLSLHSNRPIGLTFYSAP